MRSTARSASDDLLAARALDGGFAWLRFPPALEGEFRRHHLLTSQRWVRLSILVALGTTLGFAMIDHWVIRSSNAIPDVVRFGLQVPAILICLLATFEPLYVRVYERAILVGAPLFGMGTVLKRLRQDACARGYAVLCRLRQRSARGRSRAFHAGHNSAPP